MKGACSHGVLFHIFIPLRTHCWYPSFKVVLQVLMRSERQHTVGSLSLRWCPSAGHRAAAAGGRASPPGRITLLALVELPGLGKLHPGSCLDAGNLQIQLEVRARGEDR